MPLLDRVIELQSQSPPAGGDPTAGDWATVETVWAQRMDRHGFLIRYRDDIDASWRIRDSEGDLWDIAGTTETERRRWLLVSARKTGPGGR